MAVFVLLFTEIGKWCVRDCGGRGRPSIFVSLVCGSIFELRENNILGLKMVLKIGNGEKIRTS